MNDRIEKLSEQADDYADDYLGVPGEFHPNWHTVRDNKFAELIVLECAYIADQNFSLRIPTGQFMKKYFGVE
jgi:hypothetical protein